MLTNTPRKEFFNINYQLVLVKIENPPACHKPLRLVRP